METRSGFVFIEHCKDLVHPLDQLVAACHSADMEQDRIEKLLVLVLLELAATRNACVSIQALLRGSPLQRDDMLEECVLSQSSADIRERLESLVLALESLQLEEAVAWVLNQIGRKSSHPSD